MPTRRAGVAGAGVARGARLGRAGRAAPVPVTRGRRHARRVRRRMRARSSSRQPPGRRRRPYPGLVAIVAEQAWQVPGQALLQHTPSTQKPEEHCAVVVQGLPAAPTGVQTPALQKLPLTQSVLAAHGLAHARSRSVPACPFCPRGGRRRCPCRCSPRRRRAVPWRDGAPHEVVPARQSWQTPLPSHWPFCPHVASADRVHSASGSVPPRMGPQMPLAPWPCLPTAAAWQRPRTRCCSERRRRRSRSCTRRPSRRRGRSREEARTRPCCTRSRPRSRSRSRTWCCTRCWRTRTACSRCRPPGARRCPRRRRRAS